MANQPKRTYEFELPIGFVDPNGSVHRVAHLRKMTGREEALLADRKLRRNGGKLVTELLNNCMVNLGELAKVNRKVVSGMHSADRNFLLIELRKITFGPELSASYQCPHCGETTHQLEELDEMPVTRVNGSGAPDITVELEDGYYDRDGERYTTMVFRIPNGEDEEKTARLMRDNPSRGMNALLTRCLTGLGNMPGPRREALGTKLLQDLTMADRARIEKAFNAATPGVDMQRNVECDYCGRDFKTSLDLSSFFSLQ